MQDENNIKTSILFSISKGKNEEVSCPNEVEKSHIPRFFLLQKKRTSNKKIKYSEISKSGYKIGRWEEEEHRKFINSCMTYKNNWRKVKFINNI